MKFAFKLTLSLAILLLAGCAAPASQPSAESLSNLADTAFEYGRYNSAQSKYQQVLALYPNHTHARLMLARIDLLQDRPHAASSQLQQLLLEKADNAPQAAFILARYRLNQGDPHTAIDYLQQGLLLDDKHAGLYNLLAIAQDELQMHIDAEQNFQRALALEPDSKSFRVNLSFHYLLQGKVEQAQALVQPLMTGNIVPDFVTHHYALILLAQEQEQQALALLSRSMSEQQAQQDVALLKKRLSRLQ